MLSKLTFCLIRTSGNKETLELMLNSYPGATEYYTTREELRSSAKGNSSLQGSTYCHHAMHRHISVNSRRFHRPRPSHGLSIHLLATATYPSPKPGVTLAQSTREEH